MVVPFFSLKVFFKHIVNKNAVKVSEMIAKGSVSKKKHWIRGHPYCLDVSRIDRVWPCTVKPKQISLC